MGICLNFLNSIWWIVCWGEERKEVKVNLYYNSTNVSLMNPLGDIFYINL